MRFIISLLFLSALAIAQTSRPIEKEFKLWTDSEVGKELDQLFEFIEHRHDLLERASKLFYKSKVEFDDDVEARMLAEAQELMVQYNTLNESPVLKAGIKKFGYNVDGVYFLYAGISKVQKRSFGDPMSLKTFLYYNDTDQEILGLKLTGMEAKDVFGDPVSFPQTGTISGCAARAVDAFDGPFSDDFPTLHRSGKTARITKVSAKIAFKPKPK